MEAKVKERTVARRCFTKSLNNMEAMLNRASISPYSVDDFQIKAEKKRCEELYMNLAELDSEIKKLILSDSSSDENLLEKEQEECDKYKSRLLLLQFRSDTILKELHDKGPGTKCTLKLPTIELKKFVGNVKNWLSFWSQFKNIDKDINISVEDKYYYLIQCMSSQDVKSLVESYQPNNYKECITHLKERFARDELLIQIYVRELLSIITNKENLSITSLYDRLNSQLRALETLGVTKDKYAAFILPMVESALPGDVLKTYERMATHSSNMEVELNNLLKFIQKEVESEQRVNMASTSFNPVEEKPVEQKQQEPTAACLMLQTKPKETSASTATARCIWCDKQHSSLECFKLPKMKLEERREHLKKKKACALCLRQGHHAKVCRLFIKCYVCGQRHSPVLCPGIGSAPNPESKPNVQSFSCPTSGTTLLQTAAVRIIQGNKSMIVRALFDNGSQRSYIREDIVKQLQIPAVKTERLTHYLFGGVETGSKIHDIYNVKLQSIDNNFNIDIMALSQDCICKNVPKMSCNNDQLMGLLKQHHISLTEGEQTNSDVGLLIGADFTGYLLTGTIIQLEDGLVAIKTRLGWTLQGKQVGNCVNSLYTTSLFLSNHNDLTGFWSLESLGINDPTEVKSKEKQEEEALAAFEETVRINEDGRYEVQLPYKVGRKDDILNNYDLAKQRLEYTTKKLLSTDTFGSYHNIIKEWCDLGIIEMVEKPELNKNNSHYLPHRPVIKDTSLTTKVRPVFDASARDKNGKSLNSCLDKGINFIEKIPKVIAGFRKGAIGISADISRAFLQISITPADRDNLRFLWWGDRDKSEMVTYRHCRVVFGLTSSPFLLSATMHHHLQQEIFGEYSHTAELLRKSFYVDNCLVSLDSEHEVQQFIDEAKKVMNNAKFELRQWVVAPMGINETHQQEISVLGMLWDTGSDSLYCNIKTLPCLDQLKKVTKRILLSITQKVFDPIGYTGPAMLPPKLILQETWCRNLAWDQELTTDLLAQFREWYQYITYLNECRIPRRLTEDLLKNCKLSLHMFCDASKNAYGACVLLRAESEGKVLVQMIAAKSRVAPPKKMTIPRLELLAALAGSRLLANTRNDLKLPECKEYQWTDSSVVLYWIKRELEWNNFIGNRIKEIREHTKICNWFHIPGQFNWADVASRGCTAKALAECRWWEGPSWLRQAPEQWPKAEPEGDVSEAHLELKKTVLINPVYEKSELSFCIKKTGMKSLIVGPQLPKRDYYRVLRSTIPKLEHAKPGALKSADFPALNSIVSCGKEKLHGTVSLDDFIASNNGSDIKKYGAELTPDDGSFIHFTSGTTGDPKAALDSHRGVVNNTYFTGKRNMFDRGHQKICLQAPIFHALGSVITTMGGLRHGASLVLAAPTYDVKANVHAMLSEQCTAITGTPTMYVDMLQMTSEMGEIPSKLKMALAAGAPCSPQVIRDMKRQLKTEAVLALYGLTESTASIFQSLPDDSIDMVAETVGYIQDHTEVKVVDEHGKQVPFGSPGELLSRGYNNMICYWDEPEKTRQTIDDDGWLYTGDEFTISEDGYGRIVGRLKDIIVRGGENIAPKEIEDLLNTHPDIIDSQIVGVPDERLGEELCAVVRTRDGATVTTEEISKYCSGKLARYKIPRLLKFIDEFPKTGSGKVQKFKIRKLIEAGKL